MLETLFASLVSSVLRIYIQHCTYKCHVEFNLRMLEHENVKTIVEGVPDNRTSDEAVLHGQEMRVLLGISYADFGKPAMNRT